MNSGMASATINVMLKPSMVMTKRKLTCQGQSCVALYSSNKSWVRLDTHFILHGVDMLELMSSFEMSSTPQLEALIIAMR
jgi:hypothetical protein